MLILWFWILGLRIVHLFPCPHTRITAAWRHVKVSGQVHWVVPLLVAGCKLYHLRAGGTFHTKRQVYRLVESLPDNSKVPDVHYIHWCWFCASQPWYSSAYAILFSLYTILFSFLLSWWCCWVSLTAGRVCCKPLAKPNMHPCMMLCSTWQMSMCRCVATWMLSSMHPCDCTTFLLGPCLDDMKQ